MILKSATIFLCILISLTVCQYSKNQYPEFIYTPKNVTYRQSWFYRDDRWAKTKILCIF